MMEIRNSQQYEKRTTRDLMREKFLRKAIEIQPAVISDLAENVFPLTKGFGDLLRAKLHYLPKQIADVVAKTNYNFDDDYFHKAICLWARKYNLFDEWIFLEVLATLQSWKQTGIADKWTFARDIATLPVRGYKVKQNNPFFTLDFEPYDPNVETWKDYHKRLKQKFEIQTKNYRIRREAENQNIKAFNNQAEYHLKWLVEHQILGKAESEIAQRNKEGSITTISEAITRLASLMNLTLRDVPNRNRMRY